MTTEVRKKTDVSFSASTKEDFMTLQTGRPIHLSPAARRCLAAIMIYGVVGVITAFVLFNETTMQIPKWSHTS
jgi:hypothetical protein